VNALRKTALSPTRSFSDVGSSPYQRRGADKPVSDRVVKNNPGHCQERFAVRQAGAPSQCPADHHLARSINAVDLEQSRLIVVRPCAGLRLCEGAAARLKGRVVHIWIP